MKSLLFLVIALGFVSASLRAEDLTVNYKTYHNIVYGEFDACKVHCTWDNGGTGFILLKDLPPNLQVKFGYDPVIAAGALAHENAIKAAADASLKARSQPVVDATPVAAAPAVVGLTDDQIADLKARFDSVSSDLKLQHKIQGNRIGGYNDIVKNDELELSAIGKQLQDDKELKSAAALAASHPAPPVQTVSNK